MNNIRFSIVLTTYNQVDFLKEAIESVYQQTYKEKFELILVDDNSSDGTQELEMTLFDKDLDFYTIRNSRNLGLQKSYNIGTYHASGEWIIRLDHDDKLLPNALQDLSDFIDAQTDKKLAFVYSDLEIIGSGKIRIYPDYDNTLLGTQNIGHLQAVRRDASEQIGHWDVSLKYSADTDLIIRLIEAGYRIKHIAKTLYLNRHHPEQYTQQFPKKDDPNRWKDFIFKRAIEKRPDIWPEGINRQVLLSTGSPLWRSEAIFVEKYCVGNFIDLGCAGRKKHPFAVGIDVTRIGGKVPEIVWDVDEELPFRNEVLDGVMGCHIIEHTKTPAKDIDNWMKKLKVGGLLILIIPDANFIPRRGTPNCDPTHLWDWTPEDFEKGIIPKIKTSFEIIEYGPLGNNWSFSCVLRKLVNA